MDRRRVTYKIYPSKAQADRLEWLMGKHCDLYNAALQERIDAYQKNGLSIFFKDQAKSLTEIRADDPEYRSINAQSLQSTLRRLDDAFKHFFRRVKGGSGKAGFPRFKAKQRDGGWTYPTHGDG
jgi:putative transposase